MGLILLLIVLVLLFGDGGFYLGAPNHYYGGGLGTILVIVIVVLLLRGQILRAYARYYNDVRTHRSLDNVRRSRAPFSRPESSVHARSLAAFIATIFGFRFRYTQLARDALRGRAGVMRDLFSALSLSITVSDGASLICFRLRRKV